MLSGYAEACEPFGSLTLYETYVLVEILDPIPLVIRALNFFRELRVLDVLTKVFGPTGGNGIATHSRLHRWRPVKLLLEATKSSKTTKSRSAPIRRTLALLADLVDTIRKQGEASKSSSTLIEFFFLLIVWYTIGVQFTPRAAMSTPCQFFFFFVPSVH